MKELEQEEISIKVNIADVVYPLKIKPAEEESVRKAARMINDKIKTFKEEYLLEDKQVLLSMVSLQFATELLLLREQPAAKDNGLQEKIELLDGILDAALKDSE